MKVLKVGARLIMFTFMFGLVGCNSMQSSSKNKAEEKFFGMQTRQLPPEPVYSRLRWVHPPQATGAQTPVRRASQTRIDPVFHLSVERVTLERLSQLLAEAARYDSYCSSLIADKIFSFNMLGTVSELAKAIEQEAGISAVVDHENRQIRFLSGSFVAPEFYTVDQ
jgi:hypothetical protein